MRLFVEPAECRGLVPASDGPVVADRFLPVAVPVQQREHWCWAAIGAAFAAYYQGRPHDQQAVARAVCGAADTREANRPEPLDRVLTTLGCFSHWSPGKPTLARVAAEIARGRPLAVGIDWIAGGAHYVAVIGCGSGEIHVADAQLGLSVQAYAGFPHRYRGGGYWRGTYWTAPPEG